jgi:hypothetical protein
MNYEQWKEWRKTRKTPGRRPRGEQRALLPDADADADEGADTLTRLRELEPVARALVAGALGNHWVREYFEAYPAVWTEAGQRRSPTVRVEFEHAIVIGHTGEGLAAGKNKAWGPVLGVFPLEVNDPVDPYRLLYLFRDSSPYQKRFEQRRYMRERLGPGFSRLVTRAFRSTLFRFLPTLTAADVVTVSERLGVLAGGERPARPGGAPATAAVRDRTIGIGNWGSLMSHELVIESLRDLSARCTCGGWTLLSPTHDEETDESLRTRALEQFDNHLRNVAFRTTVPGSPS